MLPIDKKSWQCSNVIRTSTDQGFALRVAIFDPLVDSLKGRKRILLAPDGDLTRLPFEVLPINKAGECLIDEYLISYVSTARDILRFEEESTAKYSTDPLVAADPDFDLCIDESKKSKVSIIDNILEEIKEDRKPTNRQSRDLNSSDLHFDRLTYTENDGNKISKLLNVSPLMGEKVLESRLKSRISPMIMHIATHGFFLPNQDYDPNGVVA